MTHDAPTVAGQARAPFAGVPRRDVVRDVVGTIALFVAVPLPWDDAHRGTDRLEVVLVTVLSLLVVVAPYARRAGLLPDGWAGLTTPRARVLGNAPYLVVALVYVLLDVTASGDGRGVGSGLALGLAGAVLIAAPHWERALLVAVGVVALGAVVSPLLAAAQGEPGAVVIGAVLTALLVLGLLWLTAGRLLRGDDPAGIVLLGVGAAVALELAILSGGAERPWLESVHGERFGLLFLPVVAAFAVPRIVDRVVAARRAEAGTEHAEPERSHAERTDDETDAAAGHWITIAVRALDVVMLVAVYVAAVAVVGLVVDGVAVSLVLRLVFGLLMAGVAFVARRALVRDPRNGHVTAVGAACVIVVLGLVVVVARAGVGTRSNVEELLVTFGLPAIVLAALLIPRSVREHISRPVVSEEPSADAAADTHEASAAAPSAGAAPWSRPEADTERLAYPTEPQYQNGPYAGGESAYAGSQRPYAGGTPRGAENPAESTQVMTPVTGPAAGAAGGAHAADRGGPGSTQVLPPVQDAPGSRWTPAQALDPSTPLADLALIVQEAPHLRPHVAANPSTYPALLDWLGALGDPAVDSALRSRR